MQYRTSHHALVIAAALASATPVLAQTTVTFQQGVNGYTGTVDRTLSSSPSGNLSGGFNEDYFVDGLNTGNGSPDTQGLIRFDSLIGSAPGQIPLGATILNAELQLTTAVRSNAQTNGPWGVSRLLTGFSDDTFYTDLGPRGFDYRDGNATRPIGGFDKAAGNLGVIGNTQGPVTGANSLNQGDIAVANVAPIVEAWAKGAPNHGLTVQALSSRHSTDNGWAFGTSSHSDLSQRPKLNVTYTTDPVETVRFQQGVDGYSGTSMIFLQQNNTTTDGAFLDQGFLDGPDAAGSQDDQALVRFDNIFGDSAGVVPQGASIAKAYLVLTSGDAERSANAKSQGPFDVRQMTTDWGTDTLYAEFGEDGPSEDDGEVGSVVDQTYGRMAESEAWFDVTSILQNWSDGEANLGFNISTDQTADGWLVHFTGSDVVDARPELVVSYMVPEPTSLAVLGMGGLALLRRRRS